VTPTRAEWEYLVLIFFVNAGASGYYRDQLEVVTVLRSWGPGRGGGERETLRSLRETSHNADMGGFKVVSQDPPPTTPTTNHRCCYFLRIRSVASQDNA
jgi:hypothetical protein